MPASVSYHRTPESPSRIDILHLLGQPTQLILIVETKVNKRTRGTCYVIPQILEDFEFGLFSKYRAGEQIIEVGSAKI